MVRKYYNYLKSESTSLNEAFISVYLSLFSLHYLTVTLSVLLGCPISFY